ncbi:hypothetical protein [Alkalihalobacillus sp. AL-G]|uniref:hypothetical protein n=1 Tax=Alkalihalobacillus sp. AL-G TaxID=2926399 RepID=UPI00351B49B5
MLFSAGMGIGLLFFRSLGADFTLFKPTSWRRWDGRICQARSSIFVATLRISCMGDLCDRCPCP